ncbi:MAG: hypothetical protein KGQ59_12630, partial [Bdellovibrionales bacterium]|nr:hypothetical protein [Bdellovibrionales bacterium]
QRLPKYGHGTNAILDDLQFALGRDTAITDLQKKRFELESELNKPRRGAKKRELMRRRVSEVQGMIDFIQKKGSFCSLSQFKEAWEAARAINQIVLDPGESPCDAKNLVSSE